jgi:hypothetical protein
MVLARLAVPTFSSVVGFCIQLTKKQTCEKFNIFIRYLIHPTASGAVNFKINNKRRTTICKQIELKQHPEPQLIRARNH